MTKRLLVVLLLVLGACGGEAPRVDLARSPVASTTSSTSTTLGSPLPATPAPIEAPADGLLPGDGDEEAAPTTRAARPSRAPRAPRSAAPTAAPARTDPHGPQGRIEIPKIGLSHDTYEGIAMSQINKGPSHWSGTAQPGENGNAVFPGHRTTYTRPFWDIDKLAPGDIVTFTNPAGRFTYRITKVFIVASNAMYITDQTPGPTFTIFACHPKGSKKQRYVAQGDLVQSQRTGPTPPPPTTTPAPRSTTTTTRPAGPAPSPPGAGPTTSTTQPPIIPTLPG